MLDSLLVAKDNLVLSINLNVLREYLDFLLVTKDCCQLLKGNSFGLWDKSPENSSTDDQYNDENLCLSVISQLTQIGGWLTRRNFQPIVFNALGATSRYKRLTALLSADVKQTPLARMWVGKISL